MLCKYYIILDSYNSEEGNRIEVSSMISNIDDIKLSYTRTGLGGVVRKLGSTIKFVSEARERLIEYYREKRLDSTGIFIMEHINDDWTYEPVFECPLDFSTFSYDSREASIGCIDNSLATKIKAKKTIEYEYPVSEICEKDYLLYDGIEIENDAEYQVIGSSVDGKPYMVKETSTKDWYWIPGVCYTLSDEFSNDSFLILDQNEYMVTGGEDCGLGFLVDSCTDSYFLECVKSNYIEVDFSGFSVDEPWEETSDHRTKSHFLARIDKYDVVHLLTCTYQDLLDMNENTYCGNIRWSGQLEEGDRLQYGIWLHGHRDMGNFAHDFIIRNNCTGRLVWRERTDPVNIQVVRPQSLLDRLLLSVNGSKVESEIDYNYILDIGVDGNVVEEKNQRLVNCCLVAAESARSVGDARIYSSFSKFCEFMEAVFGYVYEIVERTSESGEVHDVVRFMHRDMMYTMSGIRKVSRMSGFSYSVSDSRIYSSVRIGYDRQDYDLGNNGKTEFNFSVSYSTGITLSDKTLTLLSPYRADSYGFEELINKGGEEGTSTGSDQQVFVVNCVHVTDDTGSRYEIVRDIAVTGSESGTVFNAAYSPQKMVEANRRYLASFCDVLRFASTDGYSGITIDGNPVTGDINMQYPLFRSGQISFSTDDTVLPSDFNSTVVHVECGGISYIGYIENVDVCPSEKELFRYELIEK